MEKIGFGGGCHWCTEAVFQDLRGVSRVEQGFIASEVPYDDFSEAVIVHYQPDIIRLSILIDVHLRTHASGAEHSMRSKYRSAIYVFCDTQIAKIEAEMRVLETEFETRRVTKILLFSEFKPSETQFRNYYISDPERPFCKTYIDPKLSKIRQKYGESIYQKSTNQNS